MSIQLTYHFDSHEALLNHLGAHSAQGDLPLQASVGVSEEPKKRGRKAAADTATAVAMPQPSKPAAVPAAKAKQAVPTVEAVKAAITEAIGDVPDFNVQVKTLINSYGFQKISDFDDATLIRAYSDAQEKIAAEGETGEVDPMG